MSNKTNNGRRRADRRLFMQQVAAGGAAVGLGVLGSGSSAHGQAQDDFSGAPTKGDIAILRLLAAAELIEADLWQQYAELGGLTEGNQNPYQLALQNLDADGSQYITSNTGDELSHADFLNAYLVSKGAEPVNFDQFRTLSSSTAAGAKQIKRLTNLMQLKVDTSWYTRYRSTTNPDFGATFPQALPALFANPHTAIPRDDGDFSPKSHIQAIANTAAFHFGFIEQAGTSLYATLSQKVSDAEVLKVTLSIGGDEICHFLEWVDFAGNGVSPPIAPFTDRRNGLTFPDFDAVPNPSYRPT